MPESKIVLAVDDDPNILELVTLVLEDAGYEVRTASNGCEGLEAIEHGLPDLILLDVSMPVMDGCSFAREFRVLHDSEIPIVLLTAAPDAKAIAREIGAAGVVRKPFDFDALLSTVGRHIKTE